MKIVKGDIVYLRAGKDVANSVGRLRSALSIKSESDFQRARAKMTMAEQIATANKENGVRGRVTRVLPDKGKVIVEGLNMVTKHQKPRANSGAGEVQQAGRMKVEAPIPVSRVMLVCPHCDKPTRVAVAFREDTRATLSGRKSVRVRDRICKHCHEVIARPTDRAGL